ncbi:retrotransposon protein, putative, Ty1-copia subclass [Cucumis melo var. makuwa]|uniref:Retrotransposon protein, putative, Ty1-copia subclass n=1 Tax=Cucumis melo var. makuwa TaxID=1194695 RepID=A0A5A7VGA0_CUCMM|nr:retrotransposon protein, putative, Ty1-copia subclass [Cucumis melo var. makuwa]
MNDNEVWDLVELPKESKRVGCKWVFKTKRDSNDNIERYKARLVAKGYTQKDGIDYKETFSPVSKKDSLRIIMALVAHYDLELHQMDVKTAFLNGNLDEEVFMDQPEGFMVEGKEHMVCKLKRSIYGLKQASRRWYQSNPGMDHWKAAKKVLRYQQGTKVYMLTYKRSDHLEVIGYSDSDFVECVDTRKSTFGYLFLLAEGAISWKSAKQSIIAESTMEAEFVACFEATIHGLWLRNFISGLGIVDSIGKPTLGIGCNALNFRASPVVRRSHHPRVAPSTVHLQPTSPSLFVSATAGSLSLPISCSRRRQNTEGSAVIAGRRKEYTELRSEADPSHESELSRAACLEIAVLSLGNATASVLSDWNCMSMDLEVTVRYVVVIGLDIDHGVWTGKDSKGTVRGRSTRGRKDA